MSSIVCKGPLGMQSTLFSLYNTGTEQSRLSQAKLKETDGIRCRMRKEKQQAGLTHTEVIASRRQVFLIRHHSTESFAGK